MKIAILDLATPFIGMETYDTAGVLIRNWLAPGLPEAAMEVFDIALGCNLPDPQDFDGFVLSGSEKGVYDQTAWMDPLRAFLLEAKRAGKPLVGICFGHQIMADTFGGRAEKVGFGMVIGAQVFDIGGQDVAAHVWHQDQVVTVPPDATVAGSSDYCPAAVLAYDFAAFSVQFHPEYTADYLKQEISIATGTILMPEAAQAAIKSIEAGHVARSVVLEQAARTLRGEVLTP